MEEIDLYEAIKQMRELTAQGRPFSFVHATYNKKTRKTTGKRIVTRASLRPAAKGDDIINADYKLFYTDETINENRVCWQMLIMFFNDKKVILK